MIDDRIRQDNQHILRMARRIPSEPAAAIMIFTRDRAGPALGIKHVP
jgi:hypothetical protein